MKLIISLTAINRPYITQLSREHEYASFGVMRFTRSEANFFRLVVHRVHLPFGVMRFTGSLRVHPPFVPDFLALGFEGARNPEFGRMSKKNTEQITGCKICRFFLI